MPSTFRVACFNAENLFDRAKVFNFQNKKIGDDILDAIKSLDGLLRQSSYNPTTKKEILNLYLKKKFDNEPLTFYIKIREDRGKLFTRSGTKITGVKANGVNDWDGTIEYKRVKFTEIARENTAKVIKTVKADVACIVEAENRLSLDAFNREMLDSKKFDYAMLIDGNDDRGIDVGVLSRFPIQTIRTHIYDGTAKSRIFSRDCLEVELELPNGKPLYLLCNHLKSRGYGSQASNDARRKRQAERLHKILKSYDLKNDWVIVAGDMNDSPDRPPFTLKKLLTTPNLFDVLELQFPNNPEKRWTYHYKKTEQIDYILVSKPLKQASIQAGVERRGIAALGQITNGAEQPFDSVTHFSNQASDHGAVWAEFQL
jgi:endonuclease/exonuclease/phosphatase family metal-dependent hydrolase